MTGRAGSGTPRRALPVSAAAPRGVNSRDVARAANVSQSTVSRVMNGHASIRSETRERVQRAVTTLGYVPNAAARSLITRRTRLLGLVVSNITNSFYPEIIEAITSRAMADGYTVIVGSAGERASSQAEYLRLLAEQRAEGVILTSTLLGDAADLRRLAASGLPIVLANRSREDLPVDSVALDNVNAARLAVAHLAGHGRRRIAYVGGRADAATDRDRFAGYLEGMAAHGIEVEQALVSHGEFTQGFGYEQTGRLLDATVVDAIIAGDDTVALGCLDALADRGSRVPQDVAVVGFDDIPAAGLRGIGLTTVSSSAKDMGWIALSLLLDRTSGRYTGLPRRVVLPARLVARSSCGAHSAADEANPQPPTAVELDLTAARPSRSGPKPAGPTH